MFDNQEVAQFADFTEEERTKIVGKKSSETTLLCLDRGQISAFTIKKKDEIELKNGECEVII